MRQLLPDRLDDVDPMALYGADARSAQPGRPWVLVNMIASADGATSVGGVSGPLGGPADKRVFAAVRAVADVVLVGAGTARAEGYGPPRRRADGTAPRIAVVTASGELDPSSRLFADAAPDGRPLVVTCSACPPERRTALAEHADVVVVAGDGRVDVDAALRALAERGAAVVVAEGGPSLNGQLVAAGLVDEWCLSLAPVLAAGRSPRPAHGDEPETPTRLRLDRLLEDHGLCFARYVRA